MSKTQTIGELLNVTRETALRLQTKGQNNRYLREARVEIERLRSLLCMFGQV